MDKVQLIDEKFIEANTDFKELIQYLQNSFAKFSALVPMRHHHDFPNPKAGTKSTLLLMPAFVPSEEAGVKIVTVNPKNSDYDLPSIHGTYIYLDAHKGTVKAIMDGKSLTAKRTAAASALASKFLSKKDSSSLLMIGTGALSKNLILAHASVRPIKDVYVYGRDIRKAQKVCKSLENESFKMHFVKEISDVISKVDIISCATLSVEPLIHGEDLQKGQHIDLVGSYKRNMREADDEVMRKGEIFVDTIEGATKESGDLIIPLEENIISLNDIKGTLNDLCTESNIGRNSDDQITVFKSVGHALEDLSAASYYYKNFMHSIASKQIAENNIFKS
ncbi:ornithine cyclodeaminase family protein [Aureivirga sp. CE67]|uniref:ornithine cyclodeaminase family protein n=1 Tax=Aureivirga sp. CE67 TaxID=1788983 RepID=UPI0018CBD4E4|nr:ornithine cyclodeaminase family protein [Aureivirga sp. CE67]